MGKKEINKTKFIVVVGIFSAIAFILQVIGSAIGIKISGFLEIEISDIPALIVSMAYGPLAGVCIELIKNVLHSFVTTTGFVGELANFCVNGMFCLVAGLIYKYHKTYKMAIVSLLTGVVALSVTGVFTNLYIMLPLYMKGVDFAAKLDLALKVILPFNIIKGLGLSFLTVILYKRISKVIK